MNEKLIKLGQIWIVAGLSAGAITLVTKRRPT